MGEEADLDAGGRGVEGVEAGHGGFCAEDDVGGVVEDDAKRAQAFVDKWTPRAQAMTNARHRRLLQVTLGETLEQKRLFEQALSGRTDLLGRRGEEVGPVVGEVLPTRWIE